MIGIHAATPTAEPVRTRGPGSPQQPPNGPLERLVAFYRRAASLAPPLFVRLRLFFLFFRTDAGFCKYWRNMAAERLCVHMS